MKKKSGTRNRNNEKVWTDEKEYLEWFEKEYPPKKKANGFRNRKTINSKDYVFKKDYKEIILSFD
jgi:hypothetical protein